LSDQSLYSTPSEPLYADEASNDSTYSAFGESDVADIQDLLQKSDENELIFDSMDDPEQEALGSFMVDPDATDEDEPSSSKKARAKQKKEAAKAKATEKAAAKAAAKAAKQDAKATKLTEMPLPTASADQASTKHISFFKRFLDFLAADDEEEQEEPKKAKQDKGDIAEKPAAKKGKKPKKEKAAKNKNTKNAKDSSGRNRGEDDEDDATAKKEKKKPKKEKPAAATEEPIPKLPRKKLIALSAVCVTIAAALLIIINLGAGAANRESAAESFHNGDYERCYLDLYDIDRNQVEETMFRKSEYILRAQIPLRSYQMYMHQGDRVRALDKLIQYVYYHPQMKAEAGRWGVTTEYDTSYTSTLLLLQETFGLSEEQALAIANEPDDVVYTQKVTAASGKDTLQ
jgi:hypothetical protein